VVMSICCRGYFVTNHPAYNRLVEDLWWHSLACAHATEMVARSQGGKGEVDLRVGVPHRPSPLQGGATEGQCRPGSSSVRSAG
jgi:hypothetical protein